MFKGVPTFFVLTSLVCLAIGVASSRGADAPAGTLRPRPWQESMDTRIEELTQAIQRRPDNVELLVSVQQAESRGTLYARRGKFKEAMADYSKAVQLDPSHHWRWYQLLSLRAYLGDLDGYRKDCGDMLQRFGNSDGGVAERLGKASLLIADQRINQTAACELADRSVNANLNGWNLLTKGIAEYRRGNYASAVPLLKQSRENLRPPRASVSIEYYQVATAATASAEFVSAMACHRLKQPGEASAAMARGMALLDDLPRAGVDDLTNPFQELLICHVFRREAEQLVAGKAGEVFVQFEIPANADVVAETHGKGKPACTAGIDVGGACLLSESEARYRCGNPNRGKGRGFGDGLPDDGRIGPVKLLPYDGNNVVQQRDDTPVTIKTQ
ncbi:MAG: tetratricopeptide repeat protein, partial [Tepidisphaeraceae bacterium]